MRSLSRVLAILFICVLSGCGTLQSIKNSSALNKAQHIQSCGPEAIQKTILQLKGEHLSKADISKEIQKNNVLSDLTRDALSIFIYKAKQITFPCEVKRFFEEKGYKVKVIKKYEDLNKEEDIALILLRRGATVYYHWISFPDDIGSISFFGKKTVIDKIYIIKK